MREIEKLRSDLRSLKTTLSMDRRSGSRAKEPITRGELAGTLSELAGVLDRIVSLIPAEEH
ncbi:hypothetical protein [Nocardioides panacihumi]